MSHHISTCIERAADCRRRGGQAIDPAIKADLLDMEARWTQLAGSYEFVESLERFLLSAHHDRNRGGMDNDTIGPDQHRPARLP